MPDMALAVGDNAVGMHLGGEDLDNRFIDIGIQDLTR